jgi:hypothetical protein
MSFSVPLDAAWFRQSLSETVVWCTGQPIDNDPAEDPAIQERRNLVSKAAGLVQRAYSIDKNKFWKSYHYACARRLFEKARPGEIAPLENQLRSSSLKPKSFSVGQSSDERLSIVQDIVTKRAESLRIDGTHPQTLLSGVPTGRLLCYVPDENLSDGAARFASKGFFDVENVPAWDTWICFLDRHLISWVPPQLIELVTRGIDANPEGCVFWAPTEAHTLP